MIGLITKLEIATMPDMMTAVNAINKVGSIVPIFADFLRWGVHDGTYPSCKIIMSIV